MCFSSKQVLLTLCVSLNLIGQSFEVRECMVWQLCYTVQGYYLELNISSTHSANLEVLNPLVFVLMMVLSNVIKKILLGVCWTLYQKPLHNTNRAGLSSAIVKIIMFRLHAYHLAVCILCLALSGHR